MLDLLLAVPPAPDTGASSTGNQPPPSSWLTDWALELAAADRRIELSRGHLPTIELDPTAAAAVVIPGPVDRAADARVDDIVSALLAAPHPPEDASAELQDPGPTRGAAPGPAISVAAQEPDVPWTLPPALVPAVGVSTGSPILDAGTRTAVSARHALDASRATQLRAVVELPEPPPEIAARTAPMSRPVEPPIESVAALRAPAPSGSIQPATVVPGPEQGETTPVAEPGSAMPASGRNDPDLVRLPQDRSPGIASLQKLRTSASSETESTKPRSPFGPTARHVAEASAIEPSMPERARFVSESDRPMRTLSTETAPPSESGSAEPVTVPAPMARRVAGTVQLEPAMPERMHDDLASEPTKRLVPLDTAERPQLRQAGPTAESSRTPPESAAPAPESVTHELPRDSVEAEHSMPMQGERPRDRGRVVVANPAPREGTPAIEPMNADRGRTIEEIRPFPAPQHGSQEAPVEPRTQIRAAEPLSEAPRTPREDGAAPAQPQHERDPKQAGAREQEHGRIERARPAEDPTAPGREPIPIREFASRQVGAYLTALRRAGLGAESMVGKDLPRLSDLGAERDPARPPVEHRETPTERPAPPIAPRERPVNDAGARSDGPPERDASVPRNIAKAITASADAEPVRMSLGGTPPPNLAPTPATSGAAPRLAPSALAEVLIAQARELPDRGSVELRFALEPEDLGLLRVRLEARGEELRIRIIAVSNAAIEGLSPTLQRLSTQLTDAGFRAPTIDVTLDGAFDPGTQQRQAERDSNVSGGSRASEHPPESRAAAAAALPALPGSPGRLDRLA